MAVGRKGHAAPVADPYGPVPGYAGRVPPAPTPGYIYVRDPAAASAKAVRDAVARFEATGAEVPEHLAELAAALGEEPDDVIIEVLSGFGAESGRYTVAEPAEPEAEPPEPEPEAEPQPPPEGEPDEADDDEAGLEDFTIAELKAELDALGVEYDPRARKADLIELIKKAE
jgi:HeH/LEM domain